MEMFDILKQFIFPELLVLVPALYVLGYAFKCAQPVPDKYIPALLGIVGVVIAAVYMLSITSTVGVQAVANMIFAAIVQGLLCAGGAVFADQLIKQAKKE